MFVQLDNLIEIFIKDSFTSETQLEIRESFTLFDDYGIVDYDIPFVSLLMESDNKDPNQTISDFITNINNQLDYIILVHGIELIDQVHFSYKNKLLRSILNFTSATPQAKAVILNYIDDPELTNEEKLCYLVSNFSDAHFESFMPLISNVSEDLIGKIYNLINYEESILLSDQKSVDTFTKFKSFINENYKNKNFTIADSIILSGFPLGLSVKDYIPFIHKLLEKLPKPELVINLFSVYVISKDFYENHYEEVYNYFQSLFEDIDFNEDFLKLTNLFKEYMNNEQN